MLVFVSGCEYIEEGIADINEEVKTSTKNEVPKVCDEITKEFKFDYDLFLLNDNELSNNYKYHVIKDENKQIINFYTTIMGNGALPCDKGSKVGQNVNYFYCESFPIKRRDIITDGEGVIRRDVQTFYVVEGMVLRFKKDINRDYGSIGLSGEYTMKVAEKWEIVSRKCYQTDFKDYSNI